MLATFVFLFNLSGLYFKTWKSLIFRASLPCVFFHNGLDLFLNVHFFHAEVFNVELSSKYFSVPTDRFKVFFP